MKTFFNITFIILMFVFNSVEAHAYLDPGSGSFIFQLIVGALLGGAFTLKLYFKKVKIFIAQFFSKKKETLKGPEYSGPAGQEKNKKDE